MVDEQRRNSSSPLLRSRLVLAGDPAFNERNVVFSMLLVHVCFQEVKRNAW